MKLMTRTLAAFFMLLVLCPRARSETVALWLFDEQAGLYPSCVLGDAASGDFPLVLGRGGQIVAGKFGNALEPSRQEELEFTDNNRWTGVERDLSIQGVAGPAAASGEPLAWPNATFCALMTRGADHLRKEVGFASATQSRLNLGDFAWTVEFWYAAVDRSAAADDSSGVVFEIGRGPRGTNDEFTRLSLDRVAAAFVFENSPAGLRVEIPTAAEAIAAAATWSHYAFVYDAQQQQLRHYVNGVLQLLPPKCRPTALATGEDDYLVVGRDGNWEHPLPGRLDELRFSTGCVYRDAFAPPESHSRRDPPSDTGPVVGPPLLFVGEADANDQVIALGHRKHLFIDDALIAARRGIEFRVNPPRLAEMVLENVAGHLIVYAGDDGLIRLYAQGPAKSLAVWTSTDGVHFEKPDLGREYRGERNVVIDDPVGLGTILVDPNAPAEERIKYVSGYRGRGIYVYSSPDGYRFSRGETSALPFRGASQSIVYYDDQRQKYVGFHRCDAAKTVGGKTSRTFVMTETDDIDRPWPFAPVSPAKHREIARRRRLSDKIPYYLDNGPLTPPGFGVEYPTVFASEETLDPLATDIYVPKCIKYPWAPDTYLAFPVVYFHYHGDGPAARQTLGIPDRGRGSGPLETQLATSRDGIDWKRYPAAGVHRHRSARAAEHAPRVHRSRHGTPRR